MRIDKEKGKIPIGPIVLMAFIAFALWVAHTGYYDKRLKVSTHYALSEAMALQDALKQFYGVHAMFPTIASDLGVPREIKFPDGGGARVLEGGVIEIYFEKLPELKEGKMYLTPSVPIQDGVSDLTWKCTTVGVELRKRVPSRCTSGK